MYLEDIVVQLKFLSPKILFVAFIFTVLTACSAGPQITKIMDESEPADKPYKKLLVIALLSSFDSRRYLEDEVVSHLAQIGVKAVASTSMMDTKTPVTRATFVAMVEKIDADAILITRLESLETTGKVVGMRPEATYNLRPTYYYNVFSVDLQEYREPPAVDMTHYLALITELVSVNKREPVWAIESTSAVAQKHDVVRDYTIFVDEASAIVDFMKRDGLVAQ